MPTSAEFQELYDNCTSVWTTVNGVAGRLFTSRINGESIFLPAAGHYNGTSLDNRGTIGFYWSSTYFNAQYATDFNFNSLGVGPSGSYYRFNGLSIRPVMEPTRGFKPGKLPVITEDLKKVDNVGVLE